MHFITLDSETEFDGWRTAARKFVLNGVKPADVTWRVKSKQPELFAPQAELLPTEPARATPASTSPQNSSNWRNQRSCIAISIALPSCIACCGGCAVIMT